MDKTRKLVLVGMGDFGQLAYDYFSDDSEYEVVGFAVEPQYLKEETLLGLPVVTLAQMPERFRPGDHHAFVAVTFTHFNRGRTRLYRAIKEMGFPIATYVSSRAFVSKRASIGENCFVFENNVIQHYAAIGNNVILWSGNHIGHHSRIADNCFVSSHVVIAGYAEIGENCFLGVNSSITDDVKVARDCWIGSAALISKNTEPGQLFHASSTPPAKVSALRFFRISEAE